VSGIARIQRQADTIKVMGPSQQSTKLSRKRGELEGSTLLLFIIYHLAGITLEVPERKQTSMHLKKPFSFCSDYIKPVKSILLELIISRIKSGIIYTRVKIIL